MCGICGTVGNPRARRRIAAALDLLTSRGPDQAGRFLGKGVGLGHRRLAILDLSEQGRQPLSNEDQSVWLVFNGEIYNFADLRAQLAPYHRFCSQTDSEVLIHGYEQWGIDGLLRRVRGMFAFALWDETTVTLHLVRDHLGKKPLYYSSLGGGLSFASTLPALLDLLETTPPVSHSAVLDYLTYLCIPAPQSIFTDIYKLPPAHRLEFCLGKAPTLYRYWEPDFTHPENQLATDWVDRTEVALKAAIRDRLVADVPVGAFLSGGIDSSLIVAIAASLTDQPLRTISIGFAEQAFNELPYARQIADIYETDHTEYLLTPDAAAVLPNLVFQYGEPFADHAALPTYYAAQAARKTVKVVLTGDGGDELFAGYRHIPAVKLAQWLHWLPPALKETLAASLYQLEQQGVRGIRKWRWVIEYMRGDLGNYRFDPVGGRTWRPYRQALLGPALSEQCLPDPGDVLYQSLWQTSNLNQWSDRALWIDLLTVLPDLLLTKLDVATMAHGLEARSPLLDLRLVELSNKIPADRKIQHWQSKSLLKHLAQKYLPREVIHRSKQGFSLPTSDWLRADLGELLEPFLLSPQARARQYFQPEIVSHFIVEHRQGRADHGQRLWSLFMLELWFQIFVDKTLSPGEGLLSTTAHPESFCRVSV